VNKDSHNVDVHKFSIIYLRRF